MHVPKAMRWLNKVLRDVSHVNCTFHTFMSFSLHHSLFLFSAHHVVLLSHPHWLPFNTTFFFFLILLSSPWRLCGLQLGPLNQFCPASRSRPFSTRCLSSETCTKLFTQVWRPVWVLMTRLRSALVMRQKWDAEALSWWSGTCSRKWWVFCLHHMLCFSCGNPQRDKRQFPNGSVVTLHSPFSEPSVSVTCMPLDCWRKLWDNPHMDREN